MVLRNVGILPYHYAVSHFTLKLEATWSSEMLVSLPHYYTASLPRRPRFEQCYDFLPTHMLYIHTQGFCRVLSFVISNFKFIAILLKS
jgi:hypothetical protein